MIAMWICAAWIVIGAGLAWAIDRSAMKADVPYGDMPSIVSLKAIRTLITVIAVVFGPFILLTAIYRTLAKKKPPADSAA